MRPKREQFKALHKMKTPAFHGQLHEGDGVVKFGTKEFTFPQPWQYVLANLAGYFIGTSSWRDIRNIMKRLKGGPAAARS